MVLVTQSQRTVQRRHAMPFGSEVLENGQVLFQLWAPRVKQAELFLEDTGRYYPMHRNGQDLHTVTTDAARPGSRYKFRMDGSDLLVPDPASRYQPQDVHGPSQVIDPTTYSWRDTAWTGRPWYEAVIYELHVGTFTPQGTFRAIIDKLEYLADLGITAIELMPIADFPGHRSWGYDGVLQFAPDSSYGTPEDLKALIEAAHQRGLMVLLDVVYNHFGPEGNYIWVYGQQFFSRKHKTPWGQAINFDGRQSRGVRDFFIHNALYWLEEYHLDGFRFDAVHAIKDDDSPTFLEELATAVHQGLGRQRAIHLVLENDDNAVYYLETCLKGHPRYFQAQWDDDWHHAAHTILTGESDGYYSDYSAHPIADLGKALTEGFVYQGQPSPFREHRPRGAASDHLPLTHFVAFLQNHDQIGNRAFGDRIATLADQKLLHMMTAILLLAPTIPMLFMGEEWGATEPFLYFCDFEPNLAKAVTRGRRREFAQFTQFQSPAARRKIPDPTLPEAFEQSKLRWPEQQAAPYANWLAYTRSLLHCRHQKLFPLLKGTLKFTHKRYTLVGDWGLAVTWTESDQSSLFLLANFGTTPVAMAIPPNGELLFETEPGAIDLLRQGQLAPQTAIWLTTQPKESVE